MKRYTLQQRGQRGAVSGFTLIEMIAVLVLIGIVMTIVGGKVMQNFQNGEYKAGVAGVYDELVRDSARPDPDRRLLLGQIA